MSANLDGNGVFFRTDEAWDFLPVDFLREMDVREEARGLRFVTGQARIESFAARHAPDFRPFTLFGSGDFHHLSAVWTRQFAEPFHILAFDNHPDWDIRPPHWSCGAWVNRSLENRWVKSVNVWGCGSFECAWPGRLLGNRRAAKAGRLQVYPWQRIGVDNPAWLHPITMEKWRDLFLKWCETRAGEKVYVTIDLDCLAAEEAVTNWESGNFTHADLVWALGALRDRVSVIGGDLCGGWSEPDYETAFQKVAGWFDHPRAPSDEPARRIAVNSRAFSEIWPALIGPSTGAS